MTKINQIHIRILDFVNYFLIIEKGKFCRMTRTCITKTIFLNSLKNHKTKSH
jgi:hypothetical protein